MAMAPIDKELISKIVADRTYLREHFGAEYAANLAGIREIVREAAEQWAVSPLTAAIRLSLKEDELGRMCLIAAGLDETESVK